MAAEGIRSKGDTQEVIALGSVVMEGRGPSVKARVLYVGDQLRSKTAEN